MRWMSSSDTVPKISSDDQFFGVGAHRLATPPRAWAPDVRLFTFVGFDALKRSRP